MTKAKKKLTNQQIMRAIIRVSSLTFRLSPGAVFMKLFGAVLNASLPIVTTFFAALTTTELAAAYGGDETAGDRAITYVLITAGLGLFMTIWSSFDQYVQALLRYRVEAKVSDTMYERFLSLDFWRYDDKDTADLYDRAYRFSQFFAYVFDRLAGLLGQLVTLIVGLIALIAVSWWLGLIVLAAVIPGVFIQFRLSRAQVAHWNKNVEVRRSRSIIEWNLLQPDHMAELRVYGVVRHLLDLRMKLRDLDERERLQYERQYIPKRLLADGLEAGAEVFALIWTVLQIMAQAQPIGQFLYVQQVVSRAIGGANGFVGQLSGLDEDLANLFDYEKFMELPTQTVGKQELREVPQQIELRNVSFVYPGAKKKVLSNIDLVIKKNQHIAIVGENGAGKSTLVKLITGLYAPTSGEISLDGLNMHDVNIGSWHGLLGVLQQDFIHYGFATARDNVVFGDVSQPFSQERLDKAIAMAEARDFLNKLPKKLDSYVNNWMEDEEGNQGTRLSGGQWQRLALARNFYRDAPIIVLDEPTSAIDALAESRIFKRLFAEKDKTLITISHRMTTVEKADEIIVIDNGRIAERGTHVELVRARGLYYRMFESQLHV